MALARMILVIAMVAGAGVERGAAADPRLVPHRIKVERAKDSPWPAPVGVTAVWGCGYDAAKCNVAVYAGSQQVGARILWAATGEAIRVIFDTSGGSPIYYLFVGDMPLPAGPKWEPHAGVTLETRRVGKGSFDTWEDAIALWQSSKPVLGRGLVGQVFHGIHPFEATANFVGKFTGYFIAPQRGEYDFSSMSTGPSFLRVDGRTLTHWPKGGGMNTSHLQGARRLDLEPGMHLLEYSCVHFGEGIWYAGAAWRPPGVKNFSIISPTNFVSVARYPATEFAPAEPVPGRTYFESRNVAHSGVDEMFLVDMEFSTVGTNAAQTYQWVFDDATTATGARVRHPFPRPGMRKVTLNVLEKGATVASLTETVAVKPQWGQQAAWHDAIYAEQFRDLAARDYSATPVADVEALVKFANRIEDRPLLTKLGGFCLKRATEFDTTLAGLFFSLALNYEHFAVRDYVAAEQAWKAAMAQGDATLRERAKLRLAAHYINIATRAADGRKLLDAVLDTSLNDNERRLKKILAGDLFLLEGKADEAAAMYKSIVTTIPAKGAGGRLDGNVPKIENARDLVRRKEFDAVDDIARQIQWERPAERMSFAVGLPQVQAFFGRREFPLARSRALQLLNGCSVDNHRAEMLYQLIEIHLALSQADLAQEAFAKLQKLYPNSEAGANAKFKWGKSVVKN